MPGCVQSFCLPKCSTVWMMVPASCSKPGMAKLCSAASLVFVMCLSAFLTYAQPTDCSMSICTRRESEPPGSCSPAPSLHVKQHYLKVTSLNPQGVSWHAGAECLRYPLTCMSHRCEPWQPTFLYGHLWRPFLRQMRFRMVVQIPSSLLAALMGLSKCLASSSYDVSPLVVLSWLDICEQPTCYEQNLCMNVGSCGDQILQTRDQGLPWQYSCRSS